MCFSYYGSKSRVATLYPKPQYPMICEPFCGSAQYSLAHWQHDVVLSDLDEKVCAVWEYLIQATKADILALPILDTGESLDDYEWKSQAEKWLMGFVIKAGSAAPALKAGPWRWKSKTSRIIKRLAEDVGKVSHWQVRQCDYRELPNIEATWFVDAPYQSSVGGHYRYGNKGIDYRELREWVLSRKGQVVVAEGLGADWLPFRALQHVNGSRRRTLEMVWTSEPAPQMELGL